MILDKDKIAWATGLFEGEGCIVFKTRGCTRRYGKKIYFQNCQELSVDSTDEDVVIKLSEIFGMNVRGPYDLPSGKKRWRTGTSSRGLFITILSAMWPYLCNRRKNRVRDYFNYLRKVR